MDYFRLAADLARAHAACTCPAYRFPHREGGGACKPEPQRYSTDPRPEWEADERKIFDAAESRAINSGATQ